MIPFLKLRIVFGVAYFQSTQAFDIFWLTSRYHLEHKEFNYTVFVSFCFSSKTTAITIFDALFDKWCFPSYFVTFLFKLIDTNQFYIHLIFFCFVRASQNKDFRPWFYSIVLHWTVYERDRNFKISTKQFLQINRAGMITLRSFYFVHQP